MTYYGRWHPLDGNMIAADSYYADEDECPYCGEEGCEECEDQYEEDST